MPTTPFWKSIASKAVRFGSMAGKVGV